MVEPNWRSDADAVSQLTPTGKLRAAINFGNPVLAQRDPSTGEPRGVTADLANGLAQRLGVEVEFKAFDTAGKVFETAQSDVWDIAFLAIDPVRAEGISFTAPYVLIEGTYLVKEDAPFERVEDIDREGVTVAVGKGAAYDLFLSRTLRHASIVRVPTSEEAIEQFETLGADTAAGVRQPLETHARQHVGFKVLQGRFTVIEQAMGCPRGRDGAARLLKRYVEYAKKTGMVAEGLRRSGQADATVAPLAPDENYS